MTRKPDRFGGAMVMGALIALVGGGWAGTTYLLPGSPVDPSALDRLLGAGLGILMAILGCSLAALAITILAIIGVSLVGAVRYVAGNLFGIEGLRRDD